MAGSREEVENVVRSIGPPVGTRTEQWVTKAAQESSFRRDVVNARGCVGYWQICPVNFGWLGVTASGLKGSASLQFRSVKRIYARQGWAAWSASGGEPDVGDIADALGHGASLTSPGDLLAGAAGLAESVPDALDPLNAIGGLVEPLAAIAGAVRGFTEWLTDPNVWRRIALVAAGGGVVLVATAALVRNTEAGQIAETVITKGASSGGGKGGGPMAQRKISAKEARQAKEA